MEVKEEDEATIVCSAHVVVAWREDFEVGVGVEGENSVFLGLVKGDLILLGGSDEGGEAVAVRFDWNEGLFDWVVVDCGAKSGDVFGVIVGGDDGITI